MHLNIKKFNKNKFLTLLIVVSFLYTSFYNLIFFELSNSPDYDYYFSYIETLFNINPETNLDQGLIYHFLISIILAISEKSINGPNFQIYVSNAIHLVNNLVFLIGLLGLNHLLKFYKIKTFDRKLILLLSIFLPFVTQARFHYKPEIFAIAFIPWIVFNTLKFLKDKKFENLIYCITLFTGTAFLKGNIFTMLSIFLFFLILKHLKDIPLIDIFKGILYFMIISTPLVYENQKFNGTNLFSNTQKRITSANYENTLSIDFFTNFSFYKFIRKPNFDPENVNFFSTIFVDTFNDFFGVSWNIDHFPMSKEFEIFENWMLNKLLNFSEYYLSFAFGVMFYSYLIYLIFKNKNEKIFFIAPFIGIFVLIINSLGFPFKNFDPAKGDTFKSIYFSFLLFISIIYLFKNLFLKVERFKKVTIVFGLVLFSIFSMGIDTEIFENKRFVSQKSFVLQHSPLCKLGEFIDFNIFDPNCNPPSDSCLEPSIKDNYTKKEVQKDGSIVFFQDDAFREIYMFNEKNQDTKLVSGFDECYHYQELGYIHSFRINNLRIPIYNIFLFTLMIGIVYKNTYDSRTKKSN